MFKNKLKLASVHILKENKCTIKLNIKEMFIKSTADIFPFEHQLGDMLYYIKINLCFRSIQIFILVFILPSTCNEFAYSN